MPTDFLTVLAEFQERNIRYMLIEGRRGTDGGFQSERWQRESGMLVLSFWDPQNRRPTVDLFAHNPMDFDALYKNSLLLPLATTNVRIVSVGVDDPAVTVAPASSVPWP